ncbi:MAG: hypothetical protein COY58_04700 [Gammaproteobacteria bacterium CG_4_10_14_0_8_um_filter_38_16]|nr:MAG: hypothetical protein COY58_04700 [Gammaproteobacteria bacterium CG_4_10_14_0_8_um_filter_38_16]PJA03157.1 MAG: hypothetical protein COX72_06655 [Gammaproteobacteria bacterium CG_4_10_14_0_2_um_filter_38_22]PJB10540.1 MAG: hypothetical protein CO120_04385 [Gammaproteobacteria bacterium CG_4_9_14_3_um_filter_38_9]
MATFFWIFLCAVFFTLAAFLITFLATFLTAFLTGFLATFFTAFFATALPAFFFFTAMGSLLNENASETNSTFYTIYENEQLPSKTVVAEPHN